jgi:hypothetical protein
MSKIKPIGSEKLQGNEKLQRIMEIAKYKEVIPNSINETSSVDYKITLADGNTYAIVKERLGYIIKKSINESTSEYIDNIKNRKHFSSYSSAMRKLNLMAGEINRVNGISEGISLFTEDKKYMLKTPQPKVEAPTEEPSDLPPPSVEPAPAPAPEDMMPTPSSDEMPASPEGEEMDTDMGDMGDMDDMGEEPSEGGEPVTFKSIQKLTGKLAQKIRDYSGEDELSSKDVKYVINSILSSLDLNSLDEEDKEEILTRFDGEEESDYGMEDMGSEDEESDEFDMDSEEIPTEEEPKPEEMGEADYLDGMFSKVFGESQVDKILKKYIVVNENEKKFVNEKKKEQKVISESRKAKYTKEIERLSLTESQSEISKKIVNNFPFITFVGKTNKGNLVFENNNKQLKVSPQGNIL